MKSSAPCAAVEDAARAATRRAATRDAPIGGAMTRGARFLALAAAAALLFAAPVSAQAPSLRLAGTSSVDVPGEMFDGSTSYPARALEVLGFRLASNAAGVTAVLGIDTLRFWSTSPYFRAGRRLHQLAFSAVLHGGATYLPEQFFIQWLPAAYPDRFEYRAGALSIRTASATTVAQSSRPAEPSSSVAAPAARSASPGVRATARNADRVVIIDPGHGGRDPGKIGPNRLAEKDVALMIAQRLAAVLRDRGYEVHLTRSTDTYVSLTERPKLANRWKGDRPVALFLSIHANSAVQTSARGFETFFLSEARTDDERRVAEIENEAINFDDHPPAPADDGLDRILNTLRSDFLMRASHDLAAAVQDRLAAIHPGPNRGVKRAGFIVLIGAIMPAVLIETAFISNRDEATLLGTRAFRDRIAGGIADSVDQFFARNEHLWVQDP